MVTWEKATSPHAWTFRRGCFLTRREIFEQKNNHNSITQEPSQTNDHGNWTSEKRLASHLKPIWITLHHTCTICCLINLIVCSLQFNYQQHLTHWYITWTYNIFYSPRTSLISPTIYNCVYQTFRGILFIWTILPTSIATPAIGTPIHQWHRRILSPSPLPYGCCCTY